MDGSRFLSASAPLPQSPAFATALAALGSDVTEVHRTEGRAVTLRRGPVRLVSRGPVWAPGCGVRDKVAMLTHLSRGGPLVINAERPRDGPALKAAGFHRIMTPATLADWPLDPDPDRLRGAMVGSWRNGLRKAEKAGLTISHQPYRPKRDRWLLELEMEQRRKARYRAWPTLLLPFLSEHMKDTIRVLAARHGPKDPPIAAIMVIQHGTRATYHIGWSNAEGRAVGANALLLTRAAQWLARRGVERLELGLVDAAALPGLLRFKLGTGAELRRLGGTWLRIIPPFR